MTADSDVVKFVNQSKSSDFTNHKARRGDRKESYFDVN